MSEIRLLTERMTALINKWVPQRFEANSELEMKDEKGIAILASIFLNESMRNEVLEHENLIVWIWLEYLQTDEQVERGSVGMQVENWMPIELNTIEAFPVSLVIMRPFQCFHHLQQLFS